MFAPRNSLIIWPSVSDISSLLECPVCYNLVLPPVKSCVLGHLLCAWCQRKVSRCPLCQNGVATTRNFFAEQILDKTLLTCKNANSGCTFVGNGEATIKHEVDCDYRPVFCPDCEETINFHQFVEHLESLHDDPQRLTLTQCCWETRVELDFWLDEKNKGPDISVAQFDWLQYCGQEFFLHVQLESKEGNSVLVFLTMLGNYIEAARWKCAIRVLNSVHGIYLEYRGPISSIRSNTADIVKSGCCLTLPSILTFKRGTEIDITVRISRASDVDPPEFRKLTLTTPTIPPKYIGVGSGQKYNLRGGGSDSVLPPYARSGRKNSIFGLVCPKTMVSKVDQKECEHFKRVIKGRKNNLFLKM